MSESMVLPDGAEQRTHRQAVHTAAHALYLRELHVQDVLSFVSFSDYRFITTQHGGDVLVYAEFDAPDNASDSHVLHVQKTRRWVIRPDASDSEIVQTAFKLVLTSIEHEAREQFQFNHRAIFGPHFDVYKLWRMFDE